MSATIITFKSKSAGEAIPPKHSIMTRKLWSDLLGMTSRQSEMAFDLSFRDPERS